MEKKLLAVTPIFLLLFTASLIFLPSCSPPLQQPGISELCAENGGKWVEEYDECENISEQACSGLGGAYDGCASPCRHNPAEICIQLCVEVCSF